jgi:hypothetical protein
VSEGMHRELISVSERLSLQGVFLLKSSAQQASARASTLNVLTNTGPFMGPDVMESEEIIISYLRLLHCGEPKGYVMIISSLIAQSPMSVLVSSSGVSPVTRLLISVGIALPSAFPISPLDFPSRQYWRRGKSRHKP